MRLFRSLLIGAVFAAALSSLYAKDKGYKQVTWEVLIPKAYRPDVIMGKYKKELDGLKEGDPKLFDIYEKIQKEFDSAPIDPTINGMMVKLPGFIIPLEDGAGVITQFLFVPEAGACIHVPPPPVNQTVMATMKKGVKVKFESAYDPYWIKGKIVTQTTKTGKAEAGYKIIDATVEPYTEP